MTIWTRRTILYVGIWIVSLIVIASAALLSDDADIKKLVPAALIASITAVVAAMIAYEASMTKTQIDRTKNDADERRREINVLFKIRYDLLKLSRRVGHENAKNDFGPKNRFERMTGTHPDPSTDGLEVPTMLWDNLADLPLGGASMAFKLKGALEEAVEALSVSEKNKEARWNGAIDTAYAQCRLLNRAIGERLELVAPGLSPEEEHEALYG